MIPIKLCTAMSLDGYIAKKDDSLDWLEGFPNPEKEDYGVEAFMATVDVVVMGKRTYEQILSFDCEWPYSNCKLFVFTHDPNYSITAPNGHLLNGVNEEAILTIKAASKKGVWVVGGGNLTKSFLEAGCVDDIMITIIPILLGDGLRLFPSQENPLEQVFDLVQAQPFKSGVVNLIYKRKQIQDAPQLSSAY